ncbi:exported protein of unknown function [Pararobbsia alpina]|uniref:hypothetical protein n=1 Tax=Pararobbsia alpina TaxID=621374 RepID=UPI0039A47CA2
MRSVKWILATSASLIACLYGQSVGAQQNDSTAVQAAPATSQTATPSDTVTASTTTPSTPQATSQATSQTAPQPTSETTTAQTADASDVMGHAISPTALDTYRGGSQTYNDMQVNGSMSDTRALGVQTGSNAITDGSFANMNGLPTVIQNTGANVLIQNATIVNVQFKQ